MGPRYAVECAAILMIMFSTQLIKGPQLISYSILLGTANHQKFATYNLVFSIANLALSIMLVQKYELIGVAAATAITQILFYGVVTPILTSKVMNFSLADYFKQTYWRILPASLILFAILSYLGNQYPPTGFLSLIGLGLVGALVYVIVAYWTLLDSEERQLALHYAGKVANKALGRAA